MPKVDGLLRIAPGLVALVLVFVALLATGTGTSRADESSPPGVSISGRFASGAPSSRPPVPSLAPAQLDQLLAPIALYPDTLLGEILIASTYPLDVVQMDRWLSDPGIGGLSGDELNSAVAPQPWDPSVKSLAAFPSVLRMMDQNLTWTQQLGDAFLANQAAVLDSVQRLRHDAQVAGRLQSTPQENVSDDGQVVELDAPASDSMYVPVYDSNLAYGAWPYPDYPPYSFPNYFDGVLTGNPELSWYTVVIVPPLWGWDHCDWHHRRVVIDGPKFSAIKGAGPTVASGAWHHDPMHRGGAPVRSVPSYTPPPPDSVATMPARTIPAGAIPETASRPVPVLPTASIPPLRPIQESPARGREPSARPSGVGLGYGEKPATPRYEERVPENRPIAAEHPYVPPAPAPVAPHAVSSHVEHPGSEFHPAAGGGDKDKEHH